MRPGSQGGAKLETRGAGPGGSARVRGREPPSGRLPRVETAALTPAPCSDCRHPGWGSSLPSPLPRPHALGGRQCPSAACHTAAVTPRLSSGPGPAQTPWAALVTAPFQR